MPLLWLGPASAQALSEVPVAVRLFFWRRLGTPRRTIAEGVSRSADRSAGPRHGTDEAAVPGNAGSICGRSSGHFGWDADAGERARLSARHLGGRDFGGFFAEHAGFSVGRANVSIADAGCGARGAREVGRARLDSDLLSRALCDSGRGEAGLRFVFRAGDALSANDGLSTADLAGECDCAGRQPRKGDSFFAQTI